MAMGGELGFASLGQLAVALWLDEADKGLGMLHPGYLTDEVIGVLMQLQLIFTDDLDQATGMSRRHIHAKLGLVVGENHAAPAAQLVIPPFLADCLEKRQDFRAFGVP
jgi:hypothetical protein